MSLNLTPEQERLVRDELEAGHFRTAEEVIDEALQALRQKERASGGASSDGEQREAVREMLEFVEKEPRAPGRYLGEGADSRGPPSVSDFVLDASLALRWFLEDEADRKYSLGVLASLSDKRALVPLLWFYEVGNGLLMGYRRKRITFDQVDGFLSRLKRLPIDAAPQTPSEILDLPHLAQTHGLTNYDAAYVALAARSGLPLATADHALRRAAAATHVALVVV